MKKLKNLLQYDAAKYIHVAIIVALYIFSYRSYIAIILLALETIYIFKKSKNILIYSLVLILLLTIRIGIINNREINLPISGEVTEVFEHSFYIKNEGLVLCYYNKTNTLKPGMIIEVQGDIYNATTYQIMNTFDYDTYLLSENISGVVSVSNINIVSKKFSIYTIKYNLTKHIDTTYDEKTASFLKLFILGEKDEIYKENSKTISNLGISHIFAISGMHLALIVGLLLFLLKKLYISEETNKTIIIFFLIIYNIITGFKISIIRATLLLIGVYLKDYFNILLTKADLLSFSFIGLLIINPYYIYNAGFQLSYLIAFSVIMGDYLYKDSKLIIRICQITLFASVVSLPITLNINHTFGLLFLVANVFFIIFVTYLFLPFSFLLIIVPFIEPIYLIIINVFDSTLNFFQQINIVLHFNFTQTLYIIIYWFSIFIYITSKKQKRKLLALLTIVLVFLFNVFIPFKSSIFVRFLDVSQGDAIHIHDTQCDMLIDTGNKDNYNTIISYFEAYNIKKIDILLITHFHSDHYGEVNDITKNIVVDKLFSNKENEEIYQKIIVLKEGDYFNCGNSRFQVLKANTDSTNENNNSIVLYALIGDDRYLFTGDIEAEIETELVKDYNFTVDILKIPHHGSSTSSTNDFIQQVKAKIGIISVGRNNSYNLPSNDVVQAYLQNHTCILRSDQSGTITMYYYEIFNLRIIESYKKNKRLVYCFACM